MGVERRSTRAAMSAATSSLPVVQRNRSARSAWSKFRPVRSLRADATGEADRRRPAGSVVGSAVGSGGGVGSPGMVGGGTRSSRVAAVSRRVESPPEGDGGAGGRGFAGSIASVRHAGSTGLRALLRRRRRTPITRSRSATRAVTPPRTNTGPRIGDDLSLRGRGVRTVRLRVGFLVLSLAFVGARADRSSVRAADRTLSGRGRAPCRASIRTLEASTR